jgi:hypothetical protein
VRGSDLTQAEAREPEQPAQTDGQEQPRGRQWTNSLPQVASEDVIAIGDGRYAHFRRDRRFAQVQAAFTAPEGVDPNPGRELTDELKRLGWAWRPNQPRKPWVYQLEQSSAHDPTACGDSRDVLHEQFLDIVQEYRVRCGRPPTSGWQPVGEFVQDAPNEDRLGSASVSLPGQADRVCEDQKPPSPEKETRAGKQAREMLDAFASVGARRFDLTFTDAAGGKVEFHGNRPLDEVRPAIPAILEEAAQQQHNVIVRPRSAGASLIQLDDLAEAAVERLRPASFLVLRTSPGNYQAWVAVADGNADFARRLCKGSGADPTASGATRISGSVNFKDKYSPDFPRVETVHVSPGRVVTRSELEALGVVAPPERTALAAAQAPRQHPGARGWPSYQRCVDNAPEAREGGRPDISRADFTFCLLAIDWGWSVEEAAARLLQESGKAQENGEAYALRTAGAAAKAIERRGERQR